MGKTQGKTIKVQIPPKLIPVFLGPARYRGAYGGRGSAKTRTFAKMAAIRGLMAAEAGQRGIILCGREYQNTLEESSLAEVKEAIYSEPFLRSRYNVGEKYVKTMDGRVNFVFAGLRRNIDSIKSKAKILILWVDEAEHISEECWRKITPTVREQDSEIWMTWNPERKGSATDKRFRKKPPKNSKIVEMNWRDNPWLTNTLNEERLNDQENRPEQYDHVWEGGYLEIATGAYFATQIQRAKAEQRWGVTVPEDPLLAIRLFVDIGGTGARADNFVIWAAQFSGLSINICNHYEVQGQPIGAHLEWLRREGYTAERGVKIWLPHDGETNDRVIDVNYRSAFEDAGYEVEVIPNQGKAAAMIRVESVRNNFNRMFFDKKCQVGMDAIAWYHPKIDDHRQADLGPDHDWSSHSADALGLLSICYTPPGPAGKFSKSLKQPKRNIA